MNSLLDFFSKNSSLSSEEQNLILEKFVEKQYRKRQYILQEDMVCKYYYFVKKGLVRVHKINEQGNLHILSFACENKWVTDMDSFYNEIPSLLSIDTLEDTHIWQISKKDLDELCIKIPQIAIVFRKITEENFARMQRKLLDICGVPTPERYLYFEQKYPHLIGRIPQVQIASFLGITPESISRIKNQNKS